MADYPYINSTGKIKPFFDQIQAIGVPPKVNLPFLVSIGFKSNGDRPLVQLARALGFIDSSGAPTDLWRSYRDKSAAPRVMAQAVRRTYGDIFDVYADAYRKDDEALRNLFTARTSLGKQAVDYMVRTFKTVCSLADFETATVAEPQQKVSLPAVLKSSSDVDDPGKSPGLTININIQLQLPATDDSVTYDNLFAALKKHLLSQG